MSALEDYEARVEREEREEAAELRAWAAEKASMAAKEAAEKARPQEELAALLAWEAQEAAARKALAVVTVHAPATAGDGQDETPQALLKRALQHTSRVPEGVAYLPTELTRSGLIRSPANGADRKEMLNQQLARGRGIKSLLYSGPELGKKEEDVWLAVLMLAKTQLIGTHISFKLAELLKLCKLTDTVNNYNAVRLRLSRLSRAHFSIDYTRKVKGKSTEFHVETHLLSLKIEVGTGDTVVWLDPAGVQLYSNLSYQPWDVRLGLATGISQQLLTYVSGHTPGKQQTIQVLDLQELFGYNGPTSRFVGACKAAMQELETEGILVAGSWKVTTTRDTETRKPIQRFTWMRTAKKPSEVECTTDSCAQFDFGHVEAEAETGSVVGEAWDDI